MELKVLRSRLGFPFRFEGWMWDLIVLLPDHCFSFHFAIRRLENSLSLSLNPAVNGYIFSNQGRIRQ